MKGMYTALLLAAALLSGGLQAKSVEENVALCEGCHSKDGLSQQADTPIIAGQPNTYIMMQFYAFQDSARQAKEKAIEGSDKIQVKTSMESIARFMDNDEIKALASYYAAKPFVAAKQDFDPTKAQAGKLLHMQYCEKCHGNEGSSTVKLAPITAGQWMPYMKKALNDFVEGRREGDSDMIAIVKNLDEQQIDQLLNFYASKQ